MASAVIDVYVKLPSGKAVCLEHLPGDTVQQISQKIADQEKLTERRVRLKYQGKLLDKSKTVGYLGIRAETILKAEILFPKDVLVTVKLDGGESKDLHMQSTDTLSMLKQKIHDKFGVQQHRQCIKWSNGSTLSGPDGKLLLDTGMEDHTTLLLSEKAPPAQSNGNSDAVFEEEVNEDIKQDLLSTFDTSGRNVEVVFCFDTTGSMYSCVEAVRNKLHETCTRLLRDIPNIRIGIMANGDYCDQEVYVVRYVDLTTDVDRVTEFTRNVPRTGGGGNGGEAYEWALRKAQQLDWSEDSAKAFVLIGDEPPHHINYTDLGLDWRQEVDVLAGMGVKVYGVKALHDNTEPFYREIAERSGGFYLQLKDFNLITDMFLAVCYREAEDSQLLENFVEEVKNEGRMTDNTKLFLDELEQKPDDQEEQETKPTAESRWKSTHSHYAWWNPDILNENNKPEYSYSSESDEWTSINSSTSSYSSGNSGQLASSVVASRSPKKSRLSRIFSIFRRKN